MTSQRVGPKTDAAPRSLKRLLGTRPGLETRGIPLRLGSSEAERGAWNCLQVLTPSSALRC